MSVRNSLLDVGGCLPDVVEVCESAGKDIVVYMQSGSRAVVGLERESSDFGTQHNGRGRR